jgi:hypothetical protein
MRCHRPETNRVAGFWWMALHDLVVGTVVLHDPNRVLSK